MADLELFRLYRFILELTSNSSKLQCHPRRRLAAAYHLISSRHSLTLIQVFTKTSGSLGGTDVAEGEVIDFERDARNASTAPDNTLKRSLKVRICNLAHQCYTS
jgi:hypothetical protein